jgi:thymidylate synthase ThyX
MTAEHEGEQPVNIEQQANLENPIRVYPMGLTSQIKRQLLKSGEQRRMVTSNRVSGIGQELRNSAAQLQRGEIELQQFLQKVRELDDIVKDGEAAYEEEREFLTHVLRTDEEIAVIFAKISRNPGSFDEIARSVTEEGAKQFHQKWTVSIEGYGHASVAEHTVIHMAVENIPSLDGDWITDNRLASFTEFSARFRGRQGVGYFTPESVACDPRLSQRWHEVHQELFAVYDKLMAKGLAYIATDEARKKWPKRQVTPKQVADQFKNLMPASRLTSIGVTMNAREKEHAIRKMLSSPYPSVRQLGALFKEQALLVASTLVKYAEANEYMVAARRGIAAIVEERRYQGYIPPFDEEKGELVDLIEADSNADNKFIAAALYRDSKTGSFRDLLNTLSGLTEAEKRKIFDQLLGKLGRWDVPIRPLEMPGDYLVEFPGMTYGVWREFHRHRILSYEIKDPDVIWGYMIPPLAHEMDESKDSYFHGSVEAIRRVLGKVDQLFIEVAKVDSQAAHYAVTRLHYRPATVKLNLREAYHLIDLRTGFPVHPFFRQLMWPLFDQICAVQPIFMDYLRLKMAKKARPDRDFPWSF